MREVYYNSNVTPSKSGDIKLMALYYDKVNLVNDFVYRDFIDEKTGSIQIIGKPFIPPEFQSEYRLLLDQGILNFTKQDNAILDNFEESFSEQIANVVRAHQETLPKITNRNAEINNLTAEVYETILYLIKYRQKDDTGPDYIWYHYAFKFKSFLNLLKEGKTCISNSEMLNYIFSVYTGRINEDNQYGSMRTIAIDALKIALPNPDNLSVEDLLELKLQLKDELINFSQTMNNIEVKYKIHDASMSQQEYQALFYAEIEKPLRELKTKMANLKSKSFRQFVDRLKDYKTYVPMIGGVVTSLPLQYTILASLGLTVGQSYLEYKEQHREIEDNGLYFLLKVK